MNFGQNIAKYRKLDNYTQQQLGELLGVTYQTVSKWELDQNQPDIETVTKMANLFHISVDCLIVNSPEAYENAKNIENHFSTSIQLMDTKLNNFEESIQIIDKLEKNMNQIVQKNKKKSFVNILFSILFFILSLGSFACILTLILIIKK